VRGCRGSGNDTIGSRCDCEGAFCRWIEMGNGQVTKRQRVLRNGRFDTHLDRCVRGIIRRWDPTLALRWNGHFQVCALRDLFATILIGPSGGPAIES
jgi:hypothetical protein